MPKIKSLHVLDNEDNEDKGSLLKSISDEEDMQELELKPTLIKEKKPRSPKQIDAFKITQENRKKSIQIKNELKKVEAAKILLKEPIKELVKLPKKKVVVDSSSEEEEVIIVEKRKKTKNKTKRIIVEQSTDEETTDDDEKQVEIKQKSFKSQQNRKSIINVNKSIVNLPKDTSTMFFV